MAAPNALAAFARDVAAPADTGPCVDLVPSGDVPCILGDDADGRAPLTRDALRKFVRDTADLMRQYGIGRDDVVCTALPNGPEAAVCFWAFSHACVYAPLNPRLTDAELAFELLDLPCHTMVVTADTPWTAAVEAVCSAHAVRVLHLVPDAHNAGRFALCEPFSVRRAPFKAPATPSDTDVALVLHTSGTTKKPKIVPLTHRNLGHGIQYVARTLRRQPADVCLNVMPLFHIHGLVANVGVSCHAGARVTCSAFLGGDDFVDKLAPTRRAQRPTWYSAVPTMHEAILTGAEARGASLDHSLSLLRNCSAALLPPVSRRLLAAFGSVVVLPTYAMTESFPICSNPPHLTVKLATVGPAMGPDVRVLASHPDAREVASGEEGEVCVRGACVTGGYLLRDHMPNDPNVEAFTADGMLRTGDKGYVDADGYLQLVGRFKEIINCGGEKVSPLELEDRLLQVHGVRTCVCFSASAEHMGEAVGVAVVSSEEDVCSPPTLSDLRDALSSHVPVQFHPRVIVYVDAIPKGPTGKPKRIGLAQALGVPPLHSGEEAVYRVRGECGIERRRADGLAREDDAYPTWVPVWSFPLTIRLELPHADYALRVEDGLCLSFCATRRSRGDIEEEAMKTTSHEAREAVAYVHFKIAERGEQWTASTTSPPTRAAYHWRGRLRVSDAHRTMTHVWPQGARTVPPGRLLRTLHVAESS